MEGKFTFLGTGSSMGVPVIGCHCAVCKSPNPKDQRMRSGALVEVGHKAFLVDAGPDVRRQALSHCIEKIDGFLLTHAHYDHVGGFDDIKLYRPSEEKKLPCLMFEETLQELKEKFSYFFQPTPEDPDNSRFFSWKTLKGLYGSVVFEGIPWNYVGFKQAGIKVLGFRLGNLAYISDIKSYEPELFDHLQGIETLIISALRETRSPMHFSIPEALEFADKLRPSKLYLTHIAHEAGYEKTQQSLPSDVFLAYDGLSLPFFLGALP